MSEDYMTTGKNIFLHNFLLTLWKDIFSDRNLVESSRLCWLHGGKCIEHTKRVKNVGGTMLKKIHVCAKMVVQTHEHKG